jgi:hypothetical protein
MPQTEQKLEFFAPIGAKELSIPEIPRKRNAVDNFVHRIIMANVYCLILKQ